LSEVTTFFRHCPSCGRRFEIRLITRKLVEEKEEVEGRKSAPLSSHSVFFNEVAESVPITVDSKEFQYSYRCKHCGHEWSEVRTKVTKA
jgi:hypothetical protein